MKIEIWKDKRGEWRYRIVHRNGNILAGPEEGYKRKSTMLRVLHNMAEAIKTARYIEVD